MRIVVTGALGNIGSQLIREFPKHFPGADVIMVDNMLTNRYCSLFDLSAYCNYQFIEADVTAVDLTNAVSNADIVIHLAAITDAVNSFHIREKVAFANFSASQIMAKYCLKHNVPIIVFSSTSVYGSQTEIMDENCAFDELKPQSPYAETKLREEKLLLKYKEKGLKFSICRFGTVCGVSPGMRFHTTINKFCWQTVMGQPLTVWRTAQFQKRPYLTLQDAVASIIHIIKRQLFNGSIFNVLTENLTVNDVIHIISKHFDNIEISYVESEIMNQLSYEVSNERFKNTGFRFRGSIEKSIQDTIVMLLNSGKRIVRVPQR